MVPFTAFFGFPQDEELHAYQALPRVITPEMQGALDREAEEAATVLAQRNANVETTSEEASDLTGLTEEEQMDRDQQTSATRHIIVPSTEELDKLFAEAKEVVERVKSWDQMTQTERRTWEQYETYLWRTHRI